MENTFRVLITGSDRLLVRILGPVNEQADFTSVKITNGPPLELDLGEMTALNSVGIRSFASWINKLENKVMELSHVPKFFVDQINMIPGLIPTRAKVSSFYVPYFNAENEQEKRVLFRQGTEYTVKDSIVTLNFPTVTDGKQEPYELDIVMEKYFVFLEHFG